jgi:hypothetical protein
MGGLSVDLRTLSQAAAGFAAHARRLFGYRVPGAPQCAPHWWADMSPGWQRSGFNDQEALGGCIKLLEKASMRTNH